MPKRIDPVIVDNERTIRRIIQVVNELSAAVAEGITNVFGESPTGTINGANTDFQTAFSYEPGKVAVFLNGLLQRAGASNDYVEVAPNIIRFNAAPIVGDVVIINYIR